ncbi:MAG: hypothetical protein WC797_00570 [Candidatus Paceibacterota bacterium]|jgi:hypothetical protein
MLNLLPKEEKTEILSEYRSRVLAFAFAGIWVALLVVVIEAGVGYAVVQGIQTDLARVTAAFDSGQLFTDVLEEAKQINRKSRVLYVPNKDIYSLAPSEIFGKVISIADKVNENLSDRKIKIYGFSYNVTDLKPKSKTGVVPTGSAVVSKKQFTIIISGSAADRPSLSEFIKKLKSESMFSAAEVPLSSVISSHDIGFSISVNLEQPKKTVVKK